MNQKDVFAFLETLSNSEEVNYDGVKLMVVGEAAAGKTTLIKALGGVEGNKLQKEKNVSTDGVDLGSLEFSKEKVYFSVWDFGGQVRSLDFCYYYYFFLLLLLFICYSYYSYFLIETLLTQIGDLSIHTPTIFKQ